MSRHPVDRQHTDNCSENAESYANFIIDNTDPKAMTLNEVQCETGKAYLAVSKKHPTCACGTHGHHED